MALVPFPITRFDGGLNDQPNVLSLQSNQVAVATNWVVNKNAIERRPGYTRRITAAITGAAKVTGLAYFRDTDFANTFVAVSNGKLWEDVSGTWTERSTGTPFDTTTLAVLVPVGRQIAITDQTNSPRIWNGSGTVDVLNSRFTRCGCMAEHKGFLFLGDPTDGSRFYYRVMHSQAPESPTVFTDGLSDTNRTDQVLALVPTADYLLIFLDTQTWYAVYSPTGPSFGSSGFQFSYKVLDPGVGVVGPRAVVNVPGRLTAFWGIRGPYIISEDPLSKPQYIGERIETFVSGIDKNNQGSIVATHWPNINSVIFYVPYGTTQTTNNYAVCWNYERNAFTIFNGSSGQAYAFASAVTIKDTDGTNQLFSGDYAGIVYKHGGAYSDDDDGYDSELWTGYLGGPDRQKLWRQLALKMDMGTRKSVMARARLYGEATEYNQTLVGGAAGDPIGSFVIGVSAIAGQNVGQLVGDIYGNPSEYIQIGVVHSQEENCRLHGITVFGEGTEQWSKSAA